MAKNNNTTRPAQGQPAAAFCAAFIPTDDNPIDPRQAFESYLELASAGDTSAAALAIGDCIVALPHVDKAAVIDLLCWLLERR